MIFSTPSSSILFYTMPIDKNFKLFKKGIEVNKVSDPETLMQLKSRFRSRG